MEHLKRIVFTLVVCSFTAALAFCGSARADPGPYERVIDFMRRVPEKAHPSRPGRYDQAGDAKEIARAIADHAPDLDAASLMTVFAAYESSNEKCVGGDWDPVAKVYRSWGAWQLQNVPKEVACDPERAAPIWLALKASAEATCSALPPEDRLAPLAGGSCSNRGGRAVSRHRFAVAKKLAREASLP